MKNTICLLLLAVMAFSCREEQKSPVQEQSHTIDSLNRLVDSLRTAARPDSAAKLKPADSAPAVAPKPKSTEKTEPKLVRANAAKSDTTFYYYTGSPRRISAYSTPWLNGKRKLVLLSPSGKITYQVDETRMSYSSVSEINSFHANGAVEKITIHDNPGASMYWSETYLGFDESNTPLTKIVQQFPERSLDEPPSFTWDKESRSWVKTEHAVQPR